MAVPPGGPVSAGIGPMQDPQYLAFLRGSGFDDEQLKNETNARRAELEAQKVLKRNSFAQALNEQRGQVQDQFQDSGFYQSGVRLQADAQAIGKVGQHQAEYEQGINQTGAGLERDLVTGLAKSARARAEEGLTAQDRVAKDNASAAAANA